MGALGETSATNSDSPLTLTGQGEEPPALSSPASPCSSTAALQRNQPPAAACEEAWSLLHP